MKINRKKNRRINLDMDRKDIRQYVDDAKEYASDGIEDMMDFAGDFKEDAIDYAGDVQKTMKRKAKRLKKDYKRAKRKYYPVDDYTPEIAIGVSLALITVGALVAAYILTKDD